MLSDLNQQFPDIPVEVWNAALPMALMELSRWKPLVKQTTMVVNTGDASMALPADFMSINIDSFDDAKAVNNRDFTYEAALFSFDTTIAAATGVPNYFGSIAKPFADGTRFDIVDDGQGGKLMAFTPTAQTNASLTFLYNAYQQVADQVVDPGSGNIITPAINTIPFDCQDAFVLALCQFGCMVQSVNTIGDTALSTRFEKLSDKFEGRFNERTRWSPFGMAK